MSETLNILMELLNEYRLSECALDEGRVSWYAARLDVRTVNERWMNGERTEEGAAMSITDELRVWGMSAHAAWKIDRADLDCLHAISDLIDAEHKKAVERARMDGMDATFGSGWVKLPVDADGVPIHVGDELTDGKVARLLICDDAEENSVYVYESPHVIKQIYCYEVVHRKPDSWEGIISDAVILGRQLEWLDNSRGDAGSERELVERCRRLAGEDE